MGVEIPQMQGLAALEEEASEQQHGGGAGETLAAMRAAALDALEAEIQSAKAALVLAPLASLCFANPDEARLSALLARRAQEADNEAGAPGVDVVRRFLADLRRVSPKGFVELQVRIDWGGG